MGEGRSVPRRRAGGTGSSTKRTRSRSSNQSKKSPIDVVIVDDHPIWRDTIRKILELRRTARIVGEAADGEEALAIVRAREPDVVVMDIDMPGIDGLEATREIHRASEGTNVLMLSASSERDKIVNAVLAGATGYLIKTARPPEVVDAVRRVHAGELVFPPDVAGAVRDAIKGYTPHSDHHVRVAVSGGSVLDREGLAGVMRTCGFDVVPLHDIASDSNDAPADVAVITLAPGLEGDADIDAILAIRRDHPRLGVLVLSHGIEDDVAARVMTGDTKGFGWLLTTRLARLRELAEAVHRVARGEAVIDPEVVGRLVKERDERTPLTDLSDRERDVLALMAEGRSNLAIAERLHMAPKTVEGHVANIFMKLGLEPAADENRRVLAVLTYLRST